MPRNMHRLRRDFISGWVKTPVDSFTRHSGYFASECHLRWIVIVNVYRLVISSCSLVIEAGSYPRPACIKAGAPLIVRRRTPESVEGTSSGDGDRRAGFVPNVIRREVSGGAVGPVNVNVSISLIGGCFRPTPRASSYAPI